MMLMLILRVDLYIKCQSCIGQSFCVSVMELVNHVKTSVVACSWEVISGSEFSSSSAPDKYVNLGIIGRAIRNTLPILVLQTILSMLTLIFSEDVGKDSSLPAWFLVSHEVELDGCPNLGSDGSLPSSG